MKLNQIFIVIISILSFVLLVLFNIIINYEFDTTSLNIKDILIKTIPPLSGAFFSGLVAYLIFHLTKEKEIANKKSESKNSLEIIKKEIHDNVTNAQSLKTALIVTSPNKIATIIEGEKELDEKKVTKKISVIEARFTTQVTDNLLNKLSNDDYLLIVEEMKNIKMIIKSLSLLSDKECGVENRTMIIENLLSFIDKLESTNEKRKLNSTSFDTYSYLGFLSSEFLIRLFFAFLVIFTSLYLLIIFSPTS